MIVDHTKGDGRHREISDGKKDGRCREISDGMKDGRRRASSEGSTSSEGGDVEDNGELDVEAVENSDKPPLPDMPSDQHGQCSKTSSERSDLLPGHWLLSPKKKFPSSRLLKPACKKPKGLVGVNPPSFLSMFVPTKLLLSSLVRNGRQAFRVIALN